MSDFEADIIKLLSSPRYQELALWKPPFDPFEIMGVAGRELSYSSVLSWLLSDSANKQFKQRFLDWLAEPIHRLDLERHSEGDESIEVRTEFGDSVAGRIDVFAVFSDLNLVVAIEVKVWAGEGDGQIGRYQSFLDRRFPEGKRAVVFLTPHGRRSATEDESSCTPVLNMSWEQVADMTSGAVGGSEENDFRVQFSNHVSRIVMNNAAERNLVLELLRHGNNAETIRRIVENYPDLGECEYMDQWKSIVSDVALVPKEEIEISQYPTKGGTTKELQIYIRNWKDRGLPFLLMLYRYQNSGVRVLMYKSDYDEHRDALDSFAERNPDIVGKYPKVPYWTMWHSVLKVHDGIGEPEETILKGADFFQDEYWVHAKEVLKDQLVETGLLRQINSWLARHTA